MSRYPYYLVDAFTTVALGGNPCAVLLDADGLDEPTMQAIAREMNLSETAFVRHSDLADFRARYFTPTREIPLAGHPTIATTAALLAADRINVPGERTTITLELNVGVIPVAIVKSAQSPVVITMTQPQPQFLRTYDPAVVLPLFGLEPADCFAGVPVQTVSTGTPQLMVPLRDHEALRHARLQVDDYLAFQQQSDFFSPHLFCLGGVTPAGQTFARHMLQSGNGEDPATGSATGGMAAYLWHYHLIDTPNFIAEQGHWIQRPSTIQVEVIGAPDAISAINVGGSAVVLIRGEMSLPEA